MTGMGMEAMLSIRPYMYIHVLTVPVAYVHVESEQTIWEWNTDQGERIGS